MVMVVLCGNDCVFGDDCVVWLRLCCMVMVWIALCSPHSYLAIRDF